MVVQLTLNSIVSAAGILLVSSGFGLTYRCCRFFNFAHGIVFTSAAYFALLARRHDFPVWAACLLGILVASAIGLAFDRAVFKPLRSRFATPLTLLLASLGLYILTRNALSLCFGEGTQILRTSAPTIGLPILGGHITLVQMIAVLLSALVIVILGLFLYSTKMGCIIRCIGGDPVLAVSSGVHVDRYFGATIALSSALAGLAGVLAAVDTDVTLDMGMNPLMAAVVAVVIGGEGRSLSGLALAALGIGFLQQFGVLWIGAAWQNTVVFALLLVFLFIRPKYFQNLSRRVFNMGA